MFCKGYIIHHYLDKYINEYNCVSFINHLGGGLSMEHKMQEMMIGLIVILFGLALVPIVFVGVSSTNWTLVSGGVSHDLSWVGYLIGLTFAVVVLALGIALLINAFNNGKK
jgi:hypothetical protein